MNLHPRITAMHRHTLFSGLIALLVSGTTVSCAPTVSDRVRSADASHPSILRTVRLSQYPFGIIDDPQTHRIFVLNGPDNNATLSGTAPLTLTSVSILDATHGSLIRTERLRGYVALDQSGQETTIDSGTGNVLLLMGARISAIGTLAGRRKIAVLDGRTGHLVHTILLDQEASGIGIDAHTRHLFVSDGPHVQVLDSATGTLLRVAPGGGSPFRVVVNAQRARVYLLSGTQDVVLNERTSTVLANVTVPTQDQEVALTVAVDVRAGHILVDLNQGHADRVCTVKLTSGQLVRCTDPLFGGGAMAVDAATGRGFILGAGYNAASNPLTVNVLDTRSGQLLDTVTLGLPDGVPASIAVSERMGRAFVVGENGWQAGSGSERGQVYVLDARTGRLLHTVLVGRGTWLAIPSIAVSERTGHVFVANTDDRTISVLDVARL